MSTIMTEEAPTRELKDVLSPPDSSEEVARRQAIKRIERRRHFYAEMLWSSIVMLMVAAIWAIAEYNNAGGWPTNGFSQSSGIHDVWNMWILYPFMAYLLYIAGCSWTYFGRKPISESEIQREIERQVRTR